MQLYVRDTESQYITILLVAIASPCAVSNIIQAENVSEQTKRYFPRFHICN
jgi:hypothetical protein